MSISSCPRCAKQVTLPVGVSNDAKVRCPLCHAQYPLSDALVTMPPLLELVEDASTGAPGDGYDLASEYRAKDSTLAAGAHRAEFPGASAAADDASHAHEPDEGLEFEAFEIEHDDLVMQEQDTEVEDLGFATSDPLVRTAPEDVDQIEIAGPDEESVLDLGQPAETLELTAQEAAGDDELSLDFGQPQLAPQPADSESAEFDLGQPQPADAGDEIEIDFGEMQEPAAASADETLDFSQDSPTGPPADDDEIGLDFGEPVVAPVAKVTQPTKSAPAAKQDKKAKDKKGAKEPKKPRPAKSGSQRSLVGRLMLIVLPGLFVVPLVYYAGLWMSPDYDILKISGKLPAFMVPRGAKKAQGIAQAPPTVLPQLPPQSPAAVDAVAESPDAPPEPVEAAPNQTPADEAPPAPTAEPAAEKPAEATAEAPPAPAPEEKDLPVSPLPAADAAGPEPKDMPAEPVQSASDEPAKDAASADDKPSAAPPEPADPLDDLISPAGEKPEELPADDAPEEMPAEATDAAVPGPLDEVADARARDLPAEVTEPAEAADALGPRDARAFTPADLAKALHEASQANEKMSTAQGANDEAEIKKIRAGFYLSFYGLADVLTFAKSGQDDPQIEDMRQGLQQALLQLTADPQRLKAVKANAAKWLRYTKRTTPGIVLAGTVQSVEPMGKLYQIQLRMTADAPVVTVISATDPRLSPEDEALTLGSIVEDPGEHLAGYEGSAAAVVWSGMTLKLPPEAH
jgi:hypothetical protein